MILPFLLMVLFFFSCGEPVTEDRFLPDSLPTEEVVKDSLSADSYLRKLQEAAKLEGKTLSEWKESERGQVSDQEITKYWQMERKSLPREGSDTDAIDRLRESIRIRIVWSRIFHKVGLPWKGKSTRILDQDLLKKLDLRNSPKFGLLDKNTRWVIVEWSDYLCNYCRETFPHTRSMLSKYGSKIFYVHKDYPLDDESKEGIFPLAVGRCLWEKDPNQFPNHMQVLYTNAKKIFRGETFSVVGSESLESCQKVDLDTKYFDQVRKDMKEASALGVSSVPTFWVNGRWIVGALNAQTWERVLKDTAH
ncbi:thioredoxin domain-containing protein [Leptospira brenneri]|uniref:Oxidoreductase n=1 Tax=Leptospira brenneri TaxID=2023182 RepID=A0A2M9Y004_9LEPT|nr:thioredoxin domain-containing protein [Leptospira brenneri]PJZ44891.1 oxidoreductase [Leptospira brenneri]TGK95310.1 oxidoreductase [Leptospira brenneri]